MPNDLSDDQRQAIEAELFAGRSIQAIKLYRAATGVGLAEAKDAVDAMKASLLQDDPTRFKAKGGSGCASVLLLAGSMAGLFAWLGVR